MTISRRTLITGVCAVIALKGIAMATAAPSTVTKLSKGRLSFKVADVPELAEVGGAVRIGNIKGKPVGVSRTAANRYVAFELACPHQGITVVRDENGWVCRKHDSQFEPDGDLVLGPATTGLKRVPIKVTRGTAVVG